MAEIQNILPYGSALKNYIAHSSITNSELKILANMKGIFLSTYDRESVLPLIETTLLLPEDYNWIRDKMKAKDDKIKRLSKSFNLKQDINLVDVLSSFSFNSEDNELNQNYTFLTKPCMAEENGDCLFEYRIRSFDKYQSWGQQESEHEGSISIRKANGKLSIEALAEYTTPETKYINDSIINSLKQHLVEKNYLDVNVKPEYIKYEDFIHNAERVRYLFSFRDLSIDGITFFDIGEVKFAPDERQKLSDSDLTWMENHVRKTIMTGKQIDRISFFDNIKNHKVLIIEEIIQKYNFDLFGAKGEIQIKIGFPEIINKLLPDTPFEFTIINIKFETENKKDLYKKIEKYLSAQFHIQKDILFEQIKSMREKTVSKSVKVETTIGAQPNDPK